jgi:hypothetical protein
MVPGGARPQWPDDPEYGQGHAGDNGVQGNGYRYDNRRGDPEAAQPQGAQYEPQYGYGRDQYGQYGGPPYDAAQGAGGAQGYGPPQPYGQAQPNGGQANNGAQPNGGQDYNGAQPNGGQDYNGYGQQGYDQQGYGQQGYGQPGNGQPGNNAPQGYNAQPNGAQDYRGDGGGQGWGYEDQQTRTYAQQGVEDQRGYADTRRYEAQGQQYADQRYQGQGSSGLGGPGGLGGPSRRPGERPGPDQGQRPPGRKVRLRRTRRFFRRRSVRIVSAILAVFLVLVMFSAGQAAIKNNGQGLSANLAEWARDHYLGPVVTFGEWLSYNPPKTGGKPSISYAVPKGEQVTATKGKGGKGFKADIPATLKPLASGAALPGEGQWRVVEKVKGEPAILTTLLRDGGQYTSYSNGIASIDQRLVKFSLRPGTEDPGAGNWGVSNYIPAGSRKGLLATFNGGFKLDSAQGGFYLNGIYHGSLVNGAASVVYYKNGKIKVGKWGRDFTLNSSIVGVRQNLKLLVDHGQLSPDANFAVNSSFGATLGGGAWVWRSGLGITKDGLIVYVYGQALDAKDLALLLQRAGAVEGMQMDINPAWMKFDYYQADGKPSDPTPVPLLSTQQPSPYTYYTPSTRDFTAVYAR